MAPTAGCTEGPQGWTRTLKHSPCPSVTGKPTGSSGLGTAGQRGAGCRHPPVPFLQPVTAHHKRPLHRPILRGGRLGRCVPPSPHQSCFPQEHVHHQHRRMGPYSVLGTARGRERQVQIPSLPRLIYFPFHAPVLHLCDRKDIAASIHPDQEGSRQPAAIGQHPSPYRDPLPEVPSETEDLGEHQRRWHHFTPQQPPPHLSVCIPLARSPRASPHPSPGSRSASPVPAATNASPARRHPEQSGGPRHHGSLGV